MGLRSLFATLALVAVVYSLRASPDVVLSKQALDALSSYIESDLRRDAETMVDTWPAELLQVYGGRDEALKAVLQTYEVEDRMALRPSLVELGTPRIFGAPSALTLAVIGGRKTAKAFPSDVVAKHVYILASEDRGRSWRVMDRTSLGCVGADIVNKVYPEASALPLDLSAAEFSAPERVLTSSSSSSR